MLNRSASLAMSTCVLKALPGKLDIKRHSPSILYIYNNANTPPEQGFLTKTGVTICLCNTCDLVTLFCLPYNMYIENTLGECLLISSLPGKALRTLVDIARLAERFNMRSQSRAW